MFSQLARVFLSRVLNPTGSALARIGITPNMVTVAGTTGVVAASVLLVPRGHLTVALVVITLCALTDMLDGAIARASGQASRWGAFLDSTADRVADGAVFGSLAYYLATQDRWASVAAALICLVTGAVVPYAKARAESLGLTSDVGFAGRAERLVILGVGGLLAGFGLHWGLDAVLWLLAVLAIVTVFQRGASVWRQTREDVSPGVESPAQPVSPGVGS